MPAAASTEKRTSCLVFSSSFFFLRKDRKSPPDRPSGGSHKTSSLKRQTRWDKQDGSNREAPPTRNQLHDDVDWLSLCTDTNKLHNVWVVILFQDPATNHRQALSNANQSQTGIFIHVWLG